VASVFGERGAFAGAYAPLEPDNDRRARRGRIGLTSVSGTDRRRERRRLALLRAHACTDPDDSGRLSDAAFFTMNGVISVAFFAFVARRVL